MNLPGKVPGAEQRHKRNGEVLVEMSWSAVKPMGHGPVGARPWGYSPQAFAGSTGVAMDCITTNHHDIKRPKGTLGAPPG